MGRAAIPYEVAFYRAVNGYGAKAVTGRDVLTVYEVRQLNAARDVGEKIINAYITREASKDFNEWERLNPQHAEMLTWAQEEFAKWQM